jgi:hypothetical protein
LFQYNTFNNIDAGNYGVAYVDHGQYATIGIADHTGMVGLQYTYQNIYPATASVLGNNTTLFFSTMLNQNHAPNPTLQSYQFSEFVPVFDNGQIDSGETIDISPVIYNSGSTALSMSNCTLTTDDEFVTVIDNETTLNLINPYQTQTVESPFRFQVSPNCPNGHTVTFNLNIVTSLTNHNFPITIMIHAPQIAFSHLQVNGAAISNIAPNVPTTATLQIRNLSHINLSYAEFSFNNIHNLQITPSVFQCNIPADGSITLSFELLASETSALGELVTLSGTFSITDVYDSLFVQSFYLGNFESLISQNFENPETFLNWIMTPGVELNQANLINPFGYELLLTPESGVDNYSITSPVIYAHDSQLVQIEFRYVNTLVGSVNTVLINYNNSDTWYNIYNFSDNSEQPIKASFTLNPELPDIYSIRLKWQVSLNGSHEGVVALDDIVVKTIHHSQGFVTGTVILDNHPELITQVRISTFEYPDIFVTPNQDGSYSLPLLQGFYSYLKAELDNFMPIYINNVNVVHNQATTINNLTLSYLRKPTAIDYQLNENSLTLNWELEAPSTRSRNMLSPTYYKIYITHDQTTTIDSSATQSFQKEIIHGIYDIYIKSVYLSSSNVEFYSDNSDSITINHTSTDISPGIPLSFELNQNYPNPFNPKTTISYSLNKSGSTKLTIYNSKGEAIRHLINEHQKAGVYKFEFDGKNNNGKQIPSGIYLYRLSSESGTLTRKMILLK